MKLHSTLIGLSVALLTATSPCLAQGETAPSVPDPCAAAKEENYWLRKQIESLRAQIEQEREACNLAASIDRSRTDMEVAERRRQAAAQEERKRQADLVSKLRQAKLTLPEWQKVLLEKNADQVRELLGQPTQAVESRSTQSFKNDYWLYGQRVRSPHDPKTLRTLRVSFTAGQVSRVDADH